VIHTDSLGRFGRNSTTRSHGRIARPPRAQKNDRWITLTPLDSPASLVRCVGRGVHPSVVKFARICSDLGRSAVWPASPKVATFGHTADAAGDTVPSCSCKITSAPIERLIGMAKDMPNDQQHGESSRAQRGRGRHLRCPVRQPDHRAGHGHNAVGHHLHEPLQTVRQNATIDWTIEEPGGGTQ
jgi:hypothetical protein